MEKYFEIKDKELGLNSNDFGVIWLTRHTAKSVGELSKGLNISQKSLYFKLKKLQQKKLVKIKRLGRGRQTLIKANEKHPSFKDIIFWAAFKVKINQKLKSGNQDEIIKVFDEELLKGDER